MPDDKLTVPVYLEGFGVFDLTPEAADEYRTAQAKSRAEHAAFIERMAQQETKEYRHLRLAQGALWAIWLLLMLTAIVLITSD